MQDIGFLAVFSLRKHACQVFFVMCNKLVVQILQNRHSDNSFFVGYVLRHLSVGLPVSPSTVARVRGTVSLLIVVFLPVISNAKMSGSGRIRTCDACFGSYKDL